MTSISSNNDSDSPCGPNAVVHAEQTALELFQTAALLTGNEQVAASLVEVALKQADIDPCADSYQAQAAVEESVVGSAIRQLSADSTTFTVPEKTVASTDSCVEQDDLAGAGVTPEELNTMLKGSGRANMRQWLNALEPVSRVIFVMRAVAGYSGSKVANLLVAHGGERAKGWDEQAVSSSYRNALCSLANQLLHVSQPA